MATTRGFSLLRFAPLFLLGLFYSLTIAPPGIYNAEFLVYRSFSTEAAGHIYVFAALVEAAILMMLPMFLIRHGARRTLLALTLLGGIGAVTLALVSSPTATLIAFLVFIGGQISIYALIDFFLEARVDGFEGVTGRVRGLYLMIVNIAFTAGPLVAGFIISQYSFELLYLFAALMSLAFFTCANYVTRGFKDSPYPHITVNYIVRTIFQNRSIVVALTINFLLQMRYAFVVVYLASYLYHVLGFSFAEIGLMVTIANIPFVLIQFPLGHSADRWLGEKELLVFGFLMTCAGGFLLAFVPTASVVTMTAILTLMFTGAAVIEIMSESYFFKHIQSKHDAHIVAFRMLIPLSYIAAPLFGGLILLSLPIQYVFAAIATVCLLGIPLALSLKDTR